MIYTGGTIGMIENPDTRALEPFDFDHLIDNVPKIKMLDFDIDNFQFEDPIDSSAMNPEHWGEIAKVIEDNYEKYDGFVVLHGTDTMAYTASALSFMLEGLDKPVIITGSQLPIGEVRTDGEENLITALQIAAERDEHGQAVVREVAILFQNFLLRGNRSTKFSAGNFDAFRSNNFPPLATIGLDIQYDTDALLTCSRQVPLSVHYNMCSDVLYLDLFPGIQQDILSHILNAPNLKGVVMKSFGAGNGPNQSWFLEEIKKAVERGLVIVNITQCSNGMVLPNRYLTGLELSKAGVVPGHDLTSEAAITKMMYLFGKGYDTAQVKKRMEESLCGELSV
ncbi:MAG: asparaginase [Bacteroidales bacterium]|nr:asparaginase [Bacteroidales bacterium]MBD5190262.1 asparaginase [Bacteroidales bacterium]MBD5208475.1 asparaginase [Bacteroidales bacterium]MDE6083914.1 asparaginase [Muribaculaceae bacterium]